MHIKTCIKKIVRKFTLYFVAWVPYKTLKSSWKYLVIKIIYMYKCTCVWIFRGQLNTKTIDFQGFWVMMSFLFYYSISCRYITNVNKLLPWSWKLMLQKERKKGPARPGPNTAVVNRRCARNKNLARLGVPTERKSPICGFL